MLNIKIVQLSYVTETDEASIFPLFVREIWRLQVVVLNVLFSLSYAKKILAHLSFCSSGYEYAMNDSHTRQSPLYLVLR